MCTFIRLSTAAPQLAPHCTSTRGTCYILVPVLEGGAAVGPAVLGWSTPSTGHAVRVSARPAAAILMLLPGVVDACVASGALVKNLLHLPNQARQSRPVPRAERDRRAFPHGKACTGRATSFPPPLRTAVRPQARSGAVPTLLRARRGRPTARPGTGLVPPTQLASPGPVAVLIQCL